MPTHGICLCLAAGRGTRGQLSVNGVEPVPDVVVLARGEPGGRLARAEQHLHVLSKGHQASSCGWNGILNGCTRELFPGKCKEKYFMWYASGNVHCASGK